jgi:hypothetical protein
MSGDRLVPFLAGLALLLFVGRAALPRGRWDLQHWAKWGAIAAFAAASCWALGMTLWWALGPGR